MIYFASETSFDGSAYPTAYAATSAGDWNGWLVPTMTADVARAFVADHSESLRFDGDTIVYADDYEGVDVRVEPNRDGTITLDLGWTFVDPDSEQADVKTRIG